MAGLPLLSAIPTVDPRTALLIGVFVGVVAILYLNRGDRWVFNVLALDEPVLVGFGVVLLLGLPGPWRLVRLVVIIAALGSRFTSLYDIG